MTRTPLKLAILVLLAAVFVPANAFGSSETAIPPANAATNPAASLVSVSCMSAGNCGAAGLYIDSSNHLRGLVLSESSGTWTPAVEATLPADAGMDPVVNIYEVSCASEGNCAAVGSYLDGLGRRHGLLVNQSSGTWGPGVRATPPAGTNANTDLYIYSVSCASAGNCAAVGTYSDGSTLQGLLLSESAGTWAIGGKASLPVGATGNAIIYSVSCPSAGNCSAVGNYVDGSGNQGLLLSQSAGTWATGVKAAPPTAATNPFVNLGSVSCPSAGNCAAVGNYGASGHQQGLLINQISGTWNSGVKATLPAGASTDPAPKLDSVSCPSAGNCAAVGSYVDGSNHRQGLLLSESSGTWGGGVRATLPAGTAPDPGVIISSVSCPSAGNCVGGGNYYDSSNQLQGLLLRQSSGTWATGVNPTLPAGANTNPVPSIESVSCPTVAGCTTVGSYKDSSGYSQGLLLDGTLLAVSKSGTGSGTVTSSPAGIDCGLFCSHDYDAGTVVTLTGVSGANTQAVSWSGCDSVTPNNECVVTMNAPRSVTATFTISQRTLAVTKVGTGSGTVTSSPAGIDCGSTCSHDYDHGTVVTLTGTSGANTQAVGWSGCDSVTPNNECVVTMNAPKNVTATFMLPPQGTLTVNKVGTGSGTVTSSPVGIDCGSTCSHDFNLQSVVTLTGTSGANTQAVGWSGCDSVTSNNECVVTMNAPRNVTATFTISQRTLTVTKGGNGSGMVTSSPAGVDCGSTCSHDYDHGTVVTLTGASGPSTEAVSWSGCDSVTPNNECVVTMNAPRNVTAGFAIIQRTLAVSKVGTGSGTVTSSPDGIACGSSCSHDYDDGTVVTLTGTPGPDSYAAPNWAGCDSITPDHKCVVSMYAAKNVTAVFTASPKTLTVTNGGTGSGTVTSSPIGIDCGLFCSHDYDHGTVVTLAGASGPSTQAVSWSGCDSVTPNNECVVTMNAPRNVTATFTISRRTLTVTKGGTGSGTVTSSPAGIDCGSSCSHDYDDGTLVTLTADPDSHSTFAGWSGGGCSGSGPCQVTMSSLQTVAATFEAVPLGLHALTVVKSGAGSGKVTSSPAGIDCGGTCTALFAEGSSVALTATPDSGSAFAGWSGGGCVDTAPCAVTMNADTSVGATFTAIGASVIAIPPPLPEAPPDTKIGRAKINQAKNSATFTFTAVGGAKFKASSGFQCALLKKTHAKPEFTACDSPKTYRHLKPRRYTFEVRAFDSAGKDPLPAKKKFSIK